MTVNPYKLFVQYLDKLMSIRREHDQEKLLLKLQEDALPLLTETIPQFNRFCGFLLNFLPDASHVDVISTVSILETILNNFPNRYYYILRVVEIIGAGLLNRGREVKAAFLKELAEVLAAAETNPEILRAVRSCKISIIQGIIMQPTTDARSEDALINLSNYQGVFLEILNRTDAFLRVVDDLIGVQDTFSSLCSLARAENAVAARSLEKIGYYAGKADDYDQLALSIIELLKRDFDTNNQDFYTCNLPQLILRAFEDFTIQRASAPLLLPYLRLARLRRETGQFIEQFDAVLNMLEESVRAELWEEDEAETIDCLLFADYLDDILACGIVNTIILPYLINFIYEKMLQAIFERNQHLKSSPEYEEKNANVIKFEQTVEKMMAAEHTRKIYFAPFQELLSDELLYNFRDIEAEADEAGIDINENKLRVASDDDLEKIAEIEHEYELVRMVMKYFGIQFFPAKFYVVCCKTASERGQITGAMIILMTLQEALVQVEDVSHFKKYFMDHTFLDLIMQPEAQQNSLQRILLIRIAHLLLERSFEIVSTDWFAKQPKYEEFVLHLFELTNSDNPQFIDGYGPDVIDFIKTMELASFENQSVESFEFCVEDQALLLLSYLSNFIGDKVFRQFSDANLDNFLYILLTNCTSFSQAVSFSSAIIFGELCCNAGVVERAKKQLFDCSEEYEQVNLTIIHNLVSFIPAISIVHRMRSGQYKKVSEISAAPLAPLVERSSCERGLSAIDALRRCLLLNNFEQKEGLVKLENLNGRFEKLNFPPDGYPEQTLSNAKNKLQVDNIMMHPIATELTDITILQPLEYLVNSASYLRVICNEIIFEIIKLEPELLINAIINFVTAAQRSANLQQALAMENINMSMSDNSLVYVKQQEAARLLKVVLGTNGFIIPELSICVIEYVEQAIERYTSLSAIDGRGQALIMGFMDLLYNSSLTGLDDKHENIIKLITNFKYEQIQDIQQYINFVSERIQIIESLNQLRMTEHDADESVYQFWLHAFRLLIRYCIKDPLRNDPSHPEFGGRIHQFFSVFFKFNQLNLEHIVEVLMLFLEPAHYSNKNVSIVFAMFLENFNTLVKQKIKYREFEDGNYSKMVIFEGNMSVRLCATFLSVVLLIHLQYGHEFQDICFILEEEIRERPPQLYGLFELLENDLPRKGSTRFKIDQSAGKPKFEAADYTTVARNIQGILLSKLHFFQPRFVQLVYSYNTSHALPQDPEELFREALDSGLLLMLVLLLSWKINELDIGQRDAIVELIGEELSSIPDNTAPANEQLAKKKLIFRFLHELQLESQQINFSVVNKHYMQIKNLLLSLFEGLCADRIACRLVAEKKLKFDQTGAGGLNSSSKHYDLDEAQHRLVKALDVELAGELVENYIEYLSCDFNVQEYEYDAEIYDIFKSYPYSFSRCLFEMGRGDIVEELYKELFAVFRRFSEEKQQKLERRELWRDKDDQTSLALLDEIINIGRIPVEFSLDGPEYGFLINAIDENSQIPEIQDRFRREILLNEPSKRRLEFTQDISTAPLMRRLLWVCAEIGLVPGRAGVGAREGADFNFNKLIAHSDKAFRFYQMQLKLFQEFVLPLSFRAQYLKRSLPAALQGYILEFRSIVFQEFKMAVESAYFCARTLASESRQTRIMAIPYLALQVQWPREFAMETMKIAIETWQIDPVAREEEWFVSWQGLEEELWECSSRYINARNYLLEFKAE